jgi:hypothetical protein
MGFQTKRVQVLPGEFLCVSILFLQIKLHAAIVMCTPLSFWSSRAHCERLSCKLQTDRFSNTEVTIQDPTPRKDVCDPEDVC